MILKILRFTVIFFVCSMIGLGLGDLLFYVLRTIFDFLYTLAPGGIGSGLQIMFVFAVVSLMVATLAVLVDD